MRVRLDLYKQIFLYFYDIFQLFSANIKDIQHKKLIMHLNHDNINFLSMLSITEIRRK